MPVDVGDDRELFRSVRSRLEEKEVAVAVVRDHDRSWRKIALDLVRRSLNLHLPLAMFRLDSLAGAERELSCRLRQQIQELAIGCCLSSHAHVYSGENYSSPSP